MDNQKHWRKLFVLIISCFVTVTHVPIMSEGVRAFPGHCGKNVGLGYHSAQVQSSIMLLRSLSDK